MNNSAVPPPPGNPPEKSPQQRYSDLTTNLTKLNDYVQGQNIDINGINGILPGVKRDLIEHIEFKIGQLKQEGTINQETLGKYKKMFEDFIGLLTDINQKMPLP